MTMDDFDAVNKTIHEKVHEDANIIIGVVIDEALGETIKVTAIVTGFGDRFESTGQTRTGMSPLTAIHKPPKQAVNIDTPTFLRDQKQSDKIRPVRHVGSVSFDDEDTYDIPTFLRKSVD